MSASPAPRLYKSIDFLDHPLCVTSNVDNSGVPIRIYAKLLPSENNLCPECEMPTSPHGWCTQRYIDRPIEGRPAVVHLETIRVRCKNESCATKTYRPGSSEDFRGTMTGRCRRYIEDNCFKRTFASLAAETSVPESTIRRFADNLLTHLNQNFRIDTPRVLSIDEVFLPSGKDQELSSEKRGSFPEKTSKTYRTIISDAETSQVVEVLRDRKLSTVVHYLLHLQGARRIRYVTMDLSNTFRDAVQVALGEQVTIIADRWHVTIAVNRAVDNERKRLKGDNRRIAKQFRLALMTRGSELKSRNPDRHRQLIDFLDNAPELSAVYQAKEGLLEVYGARSRKSAESRYDQWETELTGVARQRFAKVMALFEKWRNEIFSYWEVGFVRLLSDYEKREKLNTGRRASDPLIPTIRRLTRIEQWAGITNGKAEVRNQNIRLLNRIGRSYSFRFLRARAIFSTYRVWEHFGVCFGCDDMFKRDPRSRRFSREQRASKFAAQLEVDQVQTCGICDAGSTGVARPRKKDSHYLDSRFRLAEVWTDSEPCPADDFQCLEAAHYRWRKVKRKYTRRLTKQDRNSLDRLPDLFQNP